MKKLITLTLAAVLTATTLVACASGGSATQTAASSMAVTNAAADSREFGSKVAMGGADYTVEYEAAEMDVAEPQAAAAMADTGGGIAGPAVTPVLDSRKIIKNVSMQLQTLTFDSGVDEITKAAEGYGGYVQDSYIDGRDMYNTRGTRTASFTLRIPSETLDAFVNTLGGQFNVISKNENKQDITDNYYDSQARLDALKIQEKALLSMLEGSPDLEYLLKVQKELMNIRYEIESLTSALKRMDSQVSLSTVYISLYEVVKYEPVDNVPVTFGERISRAFSQSWIAFAEFSQDFAVVFVEALPFLIVLAVIVIIIVAIARRSHKRRVKRAQLNHLFTPYASPNAHGIPNEQTVPAEVPAEKPAEPDKE